MAKNNAVCGATTLALLSTAALLTLAPHAAAQDTSAIDEVTESEDVVVTARRRAEAIQDIPANVTALSSEDIARGGVRNIDDVARLTPGLSYTTFLGNSGSALPVIRGLSTNVGESNIGFFIDGVYQGGRSGMDRLLADVERIEVIRGPQVALYGRNAFGGAINVVTRQPSNDPRLEATATIGEGERYEASLLASGPIVQNSLYGRIGVSYQERDGFYTNDLTGNALDHRQGSSISTAALWEATPDITLDLRLGYEQADNGDSPGWFELNNNPVLFSGRSQIFLGEVPSRTSGFAVTPGGFERESFIGSLSIDVDLSSEFRFRSITAVSDLETTLRVDNDYTAADFSYQTQNNWVDEFSQEFRLERTGEAVDWVVGGYYSVTETRLRDLDQVTSLANENLLPASQRSTLIDNTEESEILAAFGSLAWRLSDAFTIEFAGRYFTEHKDVDPYQSNPWTGVVLAPNPALSLTESFFTPSLTVSYTPTGDVRLYASVARGVKSGGFNTLANVTAAEREYDSETSWNYELGAKTRWLDDRLTLNAALFYIDWEDQIVRALGSLNATLNANAGETTSQGVELEFAWRPDDNWSFGGSYAYTDSSFEDYIFQALALSFGLNPNLAGNELQYVSRHIATASLQYEAPINDAWSWFARGDVSYRSRQYGSTTNLFWVGDQTRLNAVFGVQNEDWSIELWGRNLLDDDAPTSSISQRTRASLLGPPAGQGVFRTLAFAPEPLNVGVTLRRSF